MTKRRFQDDDVSSQSSATLSEDEELDFGQIVSTKSKKKSNRMQNLKKKGAVKSSSIDNPKNIGITRTKKVNDSVAREVAVSLVEPIQKNNGTTSILPSWRDENTLNTSKSIFDLVTEQKHLDSYTPSVNIPPLNSGEQYFYFEVNDPSIDPSQLDNKTIPLNLLVNQQSNNRSNSQPNNQSNPQSDYMFCESKRAPHLLLLNGRTDSTFQIAKSFSIVKNSSSQNYTPKQPSADMLRPNNLSIPNQDVEDKVPLSKPKLPLGSTPRNHHIPKTRTNHQPKDYEPSAPSLVSVWPRSSKIHSEKTQSKKDTQSKRQKQSKHETKQSKRETKQKESKSEKTRDAKQKHDTKRISQISQKKHVNESSQKLSKNKDQSRKRKRTDTEKPSLKKRKKSKK